jgi:MFS transporter, DHA2 family, methylenomycin A resistance protein
MTTQTTTTARPVGTDPTEPQPAGRAKLSSSRAALLVAMLGFFVVALDAQIVNVALPDIRSSLGGGLSGLQWVVTGYTLMFSALQLFAGTFADRVTARRAYGTGMVLFVLVSAAAGFAPTLPLLVAARVVQGVGAALITPTSLALIREAFDDAAARGRAIAYWALGGSVAAAAGPVLGGLLTQVDWRLIFFVNLPVGAIALALLARVAPSAPRPSRFDWTGQVASVTAMATLTYGVIEGGRLGYGTTSVLLSLVLAVVAGVVFITAQARGKNPMLALDLFRSSVVSTTLIIAFITMAAFYGVVFLQSLYFQQQRGASALTTGLLFLPMTGMVAALNPLVARLMQRYGRVAIIITGQLLMVTGLLTLALAPPTAPTLLVALLMVPVGVGGSFTVPPVTAAFMDAIPAQRAGTASGVLNTARQMGGSLGVAVFGAVLAQHASFITGLRVDLTVAAALLLVLAAVTHACAGPSGLERHK